MSSIDEVRVRGESIRWPLVEIQPCAFPPQCGAPKIASRVLCVRRVRSVQRLARFFHRARRLARCEGTRDPRRVHDALIV